MIIKQSSNWAKKWNEWQFKAGSKIDRLLHFKKSTDAEIGEMIHGSSDVDTEMFDFLAELYGKKRCSKCDGLGLLDG